MRAWHRTGVATTLALLLLATPGARAEDLVITETGSTLMRPLFGLWAAGYASHHPGVRITTAGTGSEAGMQQALSGQVMIGASDAPLPDTQAVAHPEFVDIAMAWTVRRWPGSMTARSGSGMPPGSPPSIRA